MVISVDVILPTKYAASYITYVVSPARRCVAIGEYRKMLWAVMDYGSHPCAYVRLPKGHCLQGKDYMDIPINCHGGLTYSSSSLKVSAKKEIKGAWIGWDYSHYGDYCSILPFLKGKKWTTREIVAECKSVIDQIMERWKE